MRNVVIGLMELMCLFCLVLGANAQETYSYVGKPYSLCTGTYATLGPFGPQCGPWSVRGSFTTSLDLFHLQNLTNYVVPNYDILSFSFTDGLETITQSNARSAFFQLTTNAQGQINPIFGWSITLYGPVSLIATAGGGFDFSQTIGANGRPNDTGYGQTIFEDSGVWSGPEPAPTPEPSTFLSGLLALVGMAVLTRHRRKQNTH